jgi:hypothetical protein
LILSELGEQKSSLSILLNPYSYSPFTPLLFDPKSEPVAESLVAFLFAQAVSPQMHPIQMRVSPAIPLTKSFQPYIK